MKSQEITYIYGTNVVMEAFKHTGQNVTNLWLDPKVQNPELVQLARSNNAQIHTLDEKKMKKHVNPELNHQGVIASISTKSLIMSYGEFIEKTTINEKTAIMILGEIQDPQNVGAVIRSAAAFGISAVMIPQHNQAPVNGTVIKVSSGTAFTLPLVSIGNVNTVVEDLKKRGFWIYGLSGEGSHSIGHEGFEKPSAFIIGNEGEGLRSKTAEHCDILLKIPMKKKVESLNAATAAGIVGYAWSSKHPGALD